MPLRGGAFAAVLFDLDGTLVDTAGDLSDALNRMRAARGLPALAEEVLRGQASHGSRGLIALGFGVGTSDPGFPALREQFLDLYAQVLTRRSSLFPGMAEVLDALEAGGVRWGVVTNKPARFTEPLLDHLGLLDRASCVVSGDTCAQAKPAPAPMRHACRVLATEPGDCLYVGDAERDVQAGRAVGMTTLVALYGYLSEQDRPAEWGADGYLAEPRGLLRYLGQSNRIANRP